MRGDEVRDLVAESCRILHSAGQDHFYLGHVSARLKDAPDRIYVKPSGVGLGEVGPADLLVINLEGRRLEGDRPAHHEMPIHLEIYRRRPDVQSVIHTHPFYAAAFSSSTAEFAMVGQDSVLFASGVGRYPSAELVVSPSQGRALADCLGASKVVVLKNHGIAVVGSTVQEATFLTVSFDRSLRLQLAAAQLGALDPISAAEVVRMSAYFDQSYADRVNIAWDYMRRNASAPR